MNARPTAITLHRVSRLLEVAFDDGQTFRLPAEYLRVESPSAEVQGHSPDQKVLVAGKRGVAIEAVEPVASTRARATGPSSCSCTASRRGRSSTATWCPCWSTPGCAWR